MTMAWIGKPKDVTWFLSSVNADKGEDGRYVISGEPVAPGLAVAGTDMTITHLDGTPPSLGQELVVPDRTVYFVHGTPYALAAALSSTRRGTGAVKVANPPRPVGRRGNPISTADELVAAIRKWLKKKKLASEDIVFEGPDSWNERAAGLGQSEIDDGFMVVVEGTNFGSDLAGYGGPAGTRTYESFTDLLERHGWWWQAVTSWAIRVIPDSSAIRLENPAPLAWGPSGSGKKRTYSAVGYHDDGSVAGTYVIAYRRGGWRLSYKKAGEEALAVGEVGKYPSGKSGFEKAKREAAAGAARGGRWPCSPNPATVGHLERYTLHELEAMPTINSGHAADLKVDDGKHRWWVSRMTQADGEVHAVQVEEYVPRMGWRQVHGYGWPKENPAQHVHRKNFHGYAASAVNQLRSARNWIGGGDKARAWEAIRHAECDLRQAYTEATYAARGDKDVELERMATRLTRLNREVRSVMNTLRREANPATGEHINQLAMFVDQARAEIDAAEMAYVTGDMEATARIAGQAETHATFALLQIDYLRPQAGVEVPWTGEGGETIKIPDTAKLDEILVQVKKVGKRANLLYMNAVCETPRPWVGPGRVVH